VDGVDKWWRGWINLVWVSVIKGTHSRENHQIKKRCWILIDYRQAHLLNPDDEALLEDIRKLEKITIK